MKFPAAFAIWIALTAGAAAQLPSFASPGGYQSPCAFRFAFPEEQRAEGWQAPPWSDPDTWSILPREDWYRRDAYRLKTFENLAYGARPIHFPPPGFDMAPALRRERVLTVAAKLMGMHYQHHHLPNFDPYPSHPEWPWIAVRNGIHGPGQDCSNFVSWCYNYALGIRLNGAIGAASQETTVSGPDEAPLQLTSFSKDPATSFADFVAQLQPADILYIRSDGGYISHSILWVGTLASDANGKDTVFIIDSTGPGYRDSSGAPMPDGVQLRAFREDSWYFRNAAWVHRAVND